MKKKYTSEAMMVAHNLARDLYQAGAISKEEMKEHDRDCLDQALKTTPKAVPQIEKENASPAVV